jgi:hypothetical protein
MDVAIPPFAFTPQLLFDSGIKEDPNFWANRCLARYHRLRSIRLVRGATIG